MALAVAYDDAKINQVRLVKDGSAPVDGATQTPFFGGRDQPALPHAALSQRIPGLAKPKVSGTHFHAVDQFQVVINAKGKLGRHDLSPYCVHFSRAYTPYGPLVSDAAAGFTFFVLRPRYDPAAHYLPHALDKLKQVPDRKPWQITRPVSFPALQSGTATSDVVLREVPGMKDEKGLAAYTLSMKSYAKTSAPDPSHGDAQFLVVVKGSLLHDKKEHKAPALVLIRPDEGPYQIHAGSAGLEALVLSFPRTQKPATNAGTIAQARTGSKTWQCALCAFVYDEAAGLPEEGITPGTRWEDVPETWSCPDCSSSKSDFQMVEV